MNNFLDKINKKTLSSRAKSILVIEEILNGNSLSSLLDMTLSAINETDRGFFHELLVGTLRHWHALARISESLLDKEVSDQSLLVAIHVGLYQMLYMNTPDYAAINDTVEAVKQLDKGYGASLVNAILRKVQKTPAKFAKKVHKNHSLPNWLAKELKQNWSEYYDELGQALRTCAAVFLRINERQCSVEQYSGILTQHQIAHQIVKLGIDDKQTIRLDEQIRIVDLPHFQEGWLMVQDLHAQLSAHLLEKLAKNQLSGRVLDLCAAPGGKTTHLLEKFHMEQLLAIDNDEKRLLRAQENLDRLRLNDMAVQTLVADARSWQADKPYDVIVLDAPCTATGVIRRHPDIGLLRTEDDVRQTCQLQKQILNNAWRQLQVGGVLLYITCSILKAENEHQLLDFLNANTDAKPLPFTLDLPNQIKQQVGYQCLPLDTQGGDGFYYAALQKV
ncbi:16S rRNA (cytosine(967)-C(5))-methyltransferase RsmB [Moraxella sp.]|uniref:16S rRNA (cytosine(967)-C(5))-methyltransferase RsmB n=1 Tax=Moraxella sp. TaxID=479 RepID=UPI0026DB295E|nr:16S rRNA (cytosine(967)-C(5))-methyltransferase RsmB [Moraxella sp.]MDO4894876.1 16S rRNA (cytosine(967)-C(5))-methyltransferase RsmB [Moraxella sp.]